MKIYEYKEGMSLEEQKNGAYWERNMLVLLLANTLNAWDKTLGDVPCCGWYYDTDNNWDGWKRVISLDGGQYCFHIPDDFDVGNLKEISANWDGHTTKEKWIRLMNDCGCKIEGLGDKL